MEGLGLYCDCPQPTLNLKPPSLTLQTNHLDLEACVWLEEYLGKYKKCLVLVSHSQVRQKGGRGEGGGMWGVF